MTEGSTQGEAPPLPHWLRDVGTEWYSGESVLAEYGRLEEIAPAEARRIMIRFLVAQYFTNRLRGDWSERLLLQQRSAARNVIGRGLPLDRELRLAGRALELDAPESPWRERVVSLLALSAHEARARAHTAGATALYRIAYEAALAERFWSLAASSAENLAELAESADASGRRRWRRRARSLERRAQLA